MEGVVNGEVAGETVDCLGEEVTGTLSLLHRFEGCGRIF